MKNKELFKTETITRKTPLWENIPIGSKFDARIGDIKCSGRIYKTDSHIYLCQNKRDGFGPINKLGFKYSWDIGYGTLENMKEENVEIISITLDPEFKYNKPEIEYINGCLIDYYKDYIKFSNHDIQKSDLEKILEYMNTIK